MDTHARKVCIIGDFAVGKTSTIARFVHNVFSEKYLTTVGVKIDTREVEIGERTIKLVIWDIAGSDRFSAIEFSYLRGAAGYLVVVDGTRAHTLRVAQRLRNEARERYGDVAAVTLLNKADLESEWDLADDVIEQLTAAGEKVFVTSAKTGANVNEAILELAALIAG